MSKVNDLATKKLAEDLANENWKIICAFLPAGWMEQARQSGALQRARGIPDAEKLLRLLLIHVVNGCSLTETAVRATQLGLNISAVAVFKRLQAAEEWLRWLAVQQLGTKRLGLQSHGRPLRAVDATSVSEPGSTGTDWKVHYSISLSDLRCDFFELTAIEGGGETLRRVPVHRGDIMMGDRIYANPVAVSHVVDAKGDILVRLNRQTLPLYDAAEKRIDPLRLFGRIKAGQVNEWVTRVRDRKGAWILGRLIAVKRSAAATRQVRKKLLRKASKRQETVSRESLRAAQYFAVWTTLTPEDFSATEILDFYRLRWQIELAFKRMKSLLGLGHLPKKRSCERARLASRQAVRQLAGGTND